VIFGFFENSESHRICILGDVEFDVFLVWEILILGDGDSGRLRLWEI